MEFAAALVTGRAKQFAPGSFAKLHVERDGIIIENSRGEDRFTYSGVLHPEAVVTATGRQVMHEAKPKQSGIHGERAKPFSASYNSSVNPFVLLKSVALVLETNLIQTQRELQTYYILRVAMGGREMPLSLLAPAIRVSGDGKGIFRITI